MNKTSPDVIRLSVTTEVREALTIAKKRYPTLSDPEILKLGLAEITQITSAGVKASTNHAEIRRSAASAVGMDYLEDPEEDIYTL